MPDNNRTLISILKGLYSQLIQISWGLTEGLINSYKRESKAPSNITAVLNQQIDNLSSHVTCKNRECIDEVGVQGSEESKKNKKIAKDAKAENVTGVESGFAKHIQQRRPPSVTQPQMGENLKSSVWKHLNTAIRCVKNGDVDTAKLHTSIAGSALEEAGHYMSNDDYSELVLQIESYFSEHSK